MRNRSPRTRSRRPALPGLAVLALLVATLTGCLQVDADLAVEGDTVSGTLLTAIHKETAALLELDPAEVFAGENDELTSLEGVSAEPYDDGSWAGSRLTFDQVSIDDLNERSVGDPDGLRIHRDGPAGTYELSLVLDFSWMSELVEDGSAAEQQGVDVAQLLERFQVAVAVTFPDQVTEHNGQLSGTTVTWSPEPAERTELRAVALGYQGAGDPPNPDPSGSPGATGDPSADPSDPAEPGEPAAAQEPDSGSGGPGWPLLVALGLLAVAAAAAAGWWFFLRPRGNPQAGNQPADPEVE